MAAYHHAQMWHAIQCRGQYGCDNVRASLHTTDTAAIVHRTTEVANKSTMLHVTNHSSAVSHYAEQTSYLRLPSVSIQKMGH